MSGHYVIIDRPIRFNEYTCQKIKKRGMLGKYDYATVSSIETLYAKLLSQRGATIAREELVNSLVGLKRTFSKIRVRRRDSSGYISTGILVLALTVMLSIVSFLVIGNLLGR